MLMVMVMTMMLMNKRKMVVMRMISRTKLLWN